jgi:type IV pilus assembly protein PilM
MAKVRIGLDIGSTAVRAVELTGGDSPAVVRAAQAQLPAGAVENGEVRDAGAVAEGIKELWHRGKFKGRQVYCGVGNQRVVVREIALPWLPEKEMRASLGFQVQELIPMPVEEAVLDYDVIEEFQQDDRKMLRLLLVAAQRVMVDGVVSAVMSAKLEPLGLDLVPFALVRSVGTTGEGMDLDEAGAEAIVDIGAHVTNIVVHSSGTTRFVRVLPSGGRDVTLAIARSLGVDDDVAERLKRGEDVPDVENLPAAEQVQSVAIERAGTFVDEVRSSLEFYTAQSRGSAIGRLIVTGGGSRLHGLLDLMRDRIPVTVEPGRVFQHARSQLTLTEDAAAMAEPVLAVAVGLAIPGGPS